MDNSLLLALYLAQIFKFLHPKGFLVHKSILDEHGASDAPTGEPEPAEQTPQESPVVDESLGVLPSIPRGLIKNERECLEALSPMYPRKDITRFCM